MKAMIFAAGLGTRMQPLTLNRPKALIEIEGRTLLERNILYLKSGGITEIVINVHHFAEQIVDFIEKNAGFGIKIHISDEKDAVLETGGGLLRTRPFLAGEEDFLVMNVDILTDLSLKNFIAFHQKQANALATLAVTNRNSSRALLFDAHNQLKGWRNDKTQEQILIDTENTLEAFAFSGLHIISPRIFDLIQQEGKFSIITTYLDLAKTQAIYGYNHSEGKILDVGKPEAIAIAAELFG
jgi:N-acetyl-alpha-D-muramate 1-phosphate uridylyltransferase